MNDHMNIFHDYLISTKKLSANTCAAYITDVSTFEAYLSETYQKDLLSATKTMILTYILNLQKNEKSTSTIARSLSAIKSFYRCLEGAGFTTKNPSLNIRAPRIEKNYPTSLTYDEIDRFLNAPDLDTSIGVRDKAMLELMYASGIKVSELLSILVEHYHAASQSILIVSSNQRHIPVSDTAAKHIHFYLEHHRGFFVKDSEEKHLFVNRNGEAMTRQGFWKIVKGYANVSGIKKTITPQIIRNSFVVHLIQNGADMNTLMHLFGQDNITAGQMYLKSKDKHKISDLLKYHPRG
jgi:integrase/recombinase XerD